MSRLTEERRALLRALLEEEGLASSETRTIKRDKRAERQGHVPLSFAQKRMWFLDQLQPASSFYTMFETFDLKGALSVAALAHSYNELLKRHTILRTLFPVIDDEPVQIVQAPKQTFLPQIDLRALPPQERETVLHQLATTEAEQPFDFTQGPLLRLNLILLAEEEHILCFTMHHIIADGWSTAILVQELATLYRAFIEGKPTPLADLPIQYSDYAFWQQEWLRSQRYSRQLAYWKHYLAAAPTVLELPTDYPRPAIQSYQGKQRFFTLPQPLLTQLKAQSLKEGVTPFMWLLAIFQVVLYRYTGQEDILVGSPMAGRNHRELEKLIGYFANTLVLRTQLNGSQTFRAVLKRVKEVTLDAFAHQEMPFEKLVEELHIERSLSHNPLFQVMFVLQNLPPSSLALPDLAVQARLLGERKTARFDLTLALEENGPELIGSVEYNSDLFAPITIQHFIEHFQILLTETLVQPEQRLANLQLLTPTEYQKILIDWNQTQRLLPEQPCLHHLFEEQAARIPDAIALIYEEQSLTYQQLNIQANQLAHYLHRLQVGPEVPVAVCLERSLALLVSLLGILKAGGVYVPLDPRTPAQRIAKILEDTQAPILITQEHLQLSLPASQAHIISLESEWPQIERYPGHISPRTSVQPDNLAYIISTSGSTGQPKCVQIVHAAVCNLLIDLRHRLALSENEVTAALASFAFDMSLPELFLPLITGTQAVILKPDATRDAEQLLTLLLQYGITWIQATPTTWSLLLEAGLLNVHPSCRLISGAEALPWELATRLLQANCPLYNLYGPTETTVWSMQHRIHLADGQTLIGCPLANTEVYILDRYWQAVPVGVSGELYIGGSGLARGYLNQPEITADRFIPHPFSSQPGSRLYRTGDVVRYRHDGTIEYSGRADRQIKLRGFRIEPGEIEKVLRQHPAIREAVVLAREDRPNQKQLVAYLVPQGEEALQSDHLRQFLREHVPEYMLPSAFVTLATLPLTPNGKIDYDALPSSSTYRSALGKQFVAPRDHLESQLILLWQEILAVAPIGIRDNFFELGGNSFLAVRFMAQVQHQYHHKLPLSHLFQEGTIEHIAHQLRQNRQHTQQSPVVLLQRGNGYLPLFCIHPGGGNILCYRDLVYHLGQDQTVYGIEDLRLSLDDELSVCSTLEELAAFYVTAVQAIQPEGPYRLGGWSFGGLVAFEMARQLHQQDQPIALLALFDTQSPPLIRTLIDGDEGVALARFAQQQAHQAGKELPLSFETLRELDREAQIHTILQQMQQVGLALPEIVLPWVQRFLHVTRIGKQMVQSYHPAVYPGQITLFRADTASDNVEQLQLSLDALYHRPSYGWEAYSTDPVSVYLVPGTHDTIMSQPNVQILAEQLRHSML